MSYAIGIGNATTSNLWTTGTASSTGCITVSNLAYPTYQSFDFGYTKQTQVKINNKPVKKEVLSNFPFKQNNYQGFAEQLQGEFDSWIGNIRKDLFAT